jgi:hypothetical protein
MENLKRYDASVMTCHNISLSHLYQFYDINLTTCDVANYVIMKTIEVELQ